MSRIGNAPVTLPNGVEVTINDRTVTVKGPKGTLSRAIPGEIQIEQAEGSLVFTRPDDDRDNRAKHGVTRCHGENLVIG
ncbi:MAG: 50S ribosomal protein L6, partial [Ilumatobacter sp.]